MTDKLRSYGAAFREIGFSARHEQGWRPARIRLSRTAKASVVGIRGSTV